MNMYAKTKYKLFKVLIILHFESLKLMLSHKHCCHEQTIDIWVFELYIWNQITGTEYDIDWFHFNPLQSLKKNKQSNAPIQNPNLNWDCDWLLTSYNQRKCSPL